MGMNEEITTPHKLTLNCRKELKLTGVTEVIRFDENTVVLKTSMGLLSIHGRDLQLKNLSLEGSQAAVEGSIAALLYEEPRKGGTLRRLLG
jgi:sporulation protein YabP